MRKHLLLKEHSYYLPRLSVLCGSGCETPPPAVAHICHPLLRSQAQHFLTPGNIWAHVDGEDLLLLQLLQLFSCCLAFQLATQDNCEQCTKGILFGRVQYNPNVVSAGRVICISPLLSEPQILKIVSAFWFSTDQWSLQLLKYCSSECKEYMNCCTVAIRH